MIFYVFHYKILYNHTVKRSFFDDMIRLPQQSFLIWSLNVTLPYLTKTDFYQNAKQLITENDYSVKSNYSSSYQLHVFRWSQIRVPASSEYFSTNFGKTVLVNSKRHLLIRKLDCPLYVQTVSYSLNLDFKFVFLNE